MNPKHILISRTDSIGDVVLTLPLTGLLRKKFPDSKISFLGMPYTEEIIKSCVHIDQFYDWSKIKVLEEHDSVKALKAMQVDTIIHVFPRKEIVKLACKAGVPNRLGTTGRTYNWLYCNMLVPLSRRNSTLHEAQLNIRLAQRVHGYEVPPTKEISQLYGFNVSMSPEDPLHGYFSSDFYNIILHPRSKGSAREWGLTNYAGLAAKLVKNKPQTGSFVEGKPCRVFITGTADEGEMLRNEGLFENAGEVIDVTGKFNLHQFIRFISLADAIVAGSTGPLHIAAALGRTAIGLYPPIKPMHPGRWAPIGENASWIVANKECNDCRKTGNCTCMKLITIDQVQQKLNEMLISDTTQIF
jgi:ADP-heptose:LPS heptosyltransferase